MDIRRALPVSLATGALLGLVIAGFGLTTPLTLAPVVVSGPPAVEWDLPVVRNPAVERFLDLFERQQSDRMALYLKRSGRYEGMIREKLRERGMPEDLLYLSMIESGFNPNARSVAHAVGLWQFMAPTARAYGLRVDEYVDERRDPEKSTDAALRYLTDLHRQLGSWTLAAAAYNSGGNRVARIMREETGAERGRESDFWRIRGRLPGETREYVPLMFAAALIGKEPHKYGLDGVERLLPVPVRRVAVTSGIALDVIAGRIGVEPEVLRELNPHLLQGAGPPGGGYDLRVPAGRPALLARNVLRGAAVAAAAVSEGGTHRVSRGESLSSIARHHGVSVGALQHANGLAGRTLIHTGQLLRLPA